jgi:hypothetical protein
MLKMFSAKGFAVGEDVSSSGSAAAAIVAGYLCNHSCRSFRFNIETEAVSMATQGRPMPDRRAAPRLKVHLGCRFIFDGTQYEAVIKDISPTGALLWSSFMPPPAAGVFIKIETPLLRMPIVLEGKIVRRDCKNTEQGLVGAFAVRFSCNSPALMLLVNKVVNPANSRDKDQ